MKTGSIPENLFIVVRPEKEYKVKVDDKEFTYNTKPSFAVDANSDKMIVKAKYWGIHNYFTQMFKEDDLTYINTDNKEFTNLQLIDLEKRSEGGTVYKVIDDTGLLYDLRDDVFLECLYSGEIKNKGKKVYLTSNFIWAVNGSQMRIVRVNSKLYNELKDAGERRNLTVLKKKDLIPGTVYKMRNGEERAFLGNKKGQGMLICELLWDKKLPLQTRIDRQINGKQSLSWFLRYTKSHSFVEEIGKIKIPEEIKHMVE